MALRIIDHYPAINSINVPKNASVKIEFNSGIIPTSVQSSTFSVNEATTYSTQPGTLGVEYDSDGNCIRAVFQPLINYTANKKYRVYLFQQPNSIISVNNEQLTNAYTFEFTAGTGLLINEFPEGIPSGDLPTSGDVIEIYDSGIYAGLAYSGLRVIETTPLNQTPNVAVNLSSILIQFNTDIASSSSEISGYLEISSVNVLY